MALPIANQADLDARYSALVSTTDYDGNPLAKKVTGLARFKAMRELARLGTGVCDVMTIGTSMSESGSADGVLSYLNRWIEQFRDIERSKLGLLSGGVGYRPASWKSVLVVPTPYTSTTGSWNENQDFGLGRRTSEVTSTATKVYTQVCTGFDIFFTGYSGGPNLYYKIDGGSAVNFSTNNGALLSGMKVSVSGLSDASHTVEVGWVSSTAYFEGIMFYRNDQTTGFRVWDGGRSASHSTDWVTPTNWDPVIAAIQPALVVIEMTVNEGAQSITPATHTSNINALITRIRAQCTTPPSIVIMDIHAAGTRPVGEYATYKAADKALVAADASALFCDVNARTYPTETQAVLNADGLLFADTLHTLAKGSLRIAQILSDFLT